MFVCTLFLSAIFTTIDTTKQKILEKNLQNFKINNKKITFEEMFSKNIKKFSRVFPNVEEALC